MKVKLVHENKQEVEVNLDNADAFVRYGFKLTTESKKIVKEEIEKAKKAEKHQTQEFLEKLLG